MRKKRIHKSKYARLRRKETKGILAKKTMSFFRKMRKKRQRRV